MDITSFDPQQGPPRTLVRLTMNDVPRVPDADTYFRVYFNRVQTTEPDWEGNVLSVEVPDQAGTGLIMVQAFLPAAQGGGTATAWSPSNFTVTAAGPGGVPPSITTYPRTMTRGQSVTIRGQNLWNSIQQIRFMGTAGPVPIPSYRQAPIGFSFVVPNTMQPGQYRLVLILRSEGQMMLTNINVI